MKKMRILFVALAAILSLQISAMPVAAAQSKMLVVYFSMPETNRPENMTKEEDNSTVVIDGKVLGNTQYLAMLIQQQTGADIFRIEPATPYPANHKMLVDLARKEQSEKARPALSSFPRSLQQYDVIFLGYPNWWGDMPMVLYTFLEKADLTGKTIIPFNTHGGSGFSSTIRTIQVLQPKARVVQEGYSVSRDNVQESAHSDIAVWLKGLGYGR